MALVGLAAFASYGGIFHPRIDKPVIGSDALLVLGPVDEKMKPALELLRDGGADTLLVSDQYMTDDSTNGCRLEVQDVLENLGATVDFPVDVVCFRPDPLSTQGEAMSLRELGAKHEWTSVTVLAYSSHVERARMLMERCWDGELAVIAVDHHLTASEAIGTYFYQSGALVKAAVTPTCDSRLPSWLEELGWKVSSTDDRVDPASESLDRN